MEIQRAYKVELDPNNTQRTAFMQHCGAARWAWNFGLFRKMKAYRDTGKSPNAIELHRELNTLKKTPQEDGGIPWAYEVSKCAFQEALRDLDVAYKNFFRRCKNGAKKKGFPKFKSRKKAIGSFRLTGAIHVSEKTIKLPRLGSLRLKEANYLPNPKENKSVKILSATVSEKSGKWFVSLSVKEQVPDLKPKTKIKSTGLDVGIKSLIVLSDETVIENPRALKKLESKLKRLQRSFSRKKKGSSNRRKAKRKVQRLHYKISCIRKDFIHKATSKIIESFDLIGIETLNVSGMLKNHCLAKALSDASLSEILRQLKYKATWRGVQIVEAPQFYPSTKTCSCCGHVKDKMILSERVYRCDKCGLVLDRDLNAARNLEKMAVSSTVSVCGEESADFNDMMKLSSLKQKSNIRPL